MIGVCTQSKPYALVLEFYGISGKCVTLAKAAKENLLAEEAMWARAMIECCEALDYLHKKSYIHCDLKANNIVFNEVESQFFPIIIDFGKMRHSNDGFKYKLSTQEQERYRQKYTRNVRNTKC